MKYSIEIICKATILLILLLQVSFKGAAQITVVSPSAGQTIIVGNSITLYYTCPYYVSSTIAEVYRGTTLVYTQWGSIYQSSNNYVSTTGFPPGSDYRIKVYESSYPTSNPSNYGWSDYFAVLPAATPIATAATYLGTTGFQANWTSDPTPTWFHLDVSTDPNFGTFVSGYNDYRFAASQSYLYVSGLQPGATYYYRVRGESGAGIGNNSNVISVTLYPATPVAQAATDVTASSFTANWSSVTGIVSDYRLDVSTNSGFTAMVPGYNDLSVAGTSRSVTGLSSNTVYYYRVRARNGAGSSVNSNVITTANLTVVSPSPSQQITAGTDITFRYNSPISIGYGIAQVYKGSSVVATSTGANPGTDISINTNSFQPGTDYRIKIYDGANASIHGWSGYFSIVALSPPVAISASSITASSFTANWNLAAGASGYVIDVSTVNTFTSFVSNYNNLSTSSLTGSATSGSIYNSISPATYYYYRLRSVNSSGQSASSNVITVLTLPIAPVAQPATDVTANSFTANWSSVSGIVSDYRLDVSTNSSFTAMVPGYNDLSVAGTNRAVTGLLSNTVYYYRVRARNGSGSSVNSNVITTANLTVVSPSPGQEITAGMDITFRYSSPMSIGYGIAQIYKGSAVVATSTGANPDTDISINTNSFQPGTDYRIKIYDHTNPSVHGWSGYFEVVPSINFIQETTVFVKDKRTAADVKALQIADGQKSVSINYMDGLGRSMQRVTKQSLPGAKDVALPVIYDATGRETRKYLPLPTDENTGIYKDNNSIIAADGNYSNNYYNDSRPFNEIIFEASPLSRPKQEFGPGEAWNNSTVQKFVAHHYLVNVHGTGIGQEQIIAWKIDDLDMPIRQNVVNSSVSGGYYASNQLYIKSMIDEHGRETREYTGKEGRVILKKVQAVDDPELNNRDHWALTYYVYDDAGNLRYVFQPELSRKTHQNNSYNPSVTDLNDLAFQYKYDAQRRTIEKKLPGALAVYMVYDKANRLIFTQDGNQRSNNQWLFTRYDELNRPVITGIYTHNALFTQQQMAALVKDTYRFETYTGDNNHHGYSNTMFTAPEFVTSNFEVLTITYYDSYTFKGLLNDTDFDYKNNELPETSLYPGQDANEFTGTKGLITATKVKVLDNGSTWLWSVNYYDNRYRTIQTTSSNYRGGAADGVMRTTNIYDFAGRVLRTKTFYSLTGHSDRKIVQRFGYDHSGRLLNVWHQVEGGPEIIILSNEYNALEQLVRKKLHSPVQEGYPESYLESIDYGYNIRGWLTRINDPWASATDDLFAMELRYNDPTANGGSAQFNGNISEAVWKSAGQDKQSYGYHYDPMSRITKGLYYNVQKPSENGRFNERVGDPDLLRPAYDLNGNILNIFRNGKKAESLYEQIDDLEYTYTAGNRLLTVTDHIPTHASEEGFKEIESTSDYVYDDNGNMIVDNNKGLTGSTPIVYNYLNLPSKVSKSTTDYVTYTYDATGRKLAQQVFGSSPKITEYFGSMVLEDNVLQFILHPEGRIIPDNTTGASDPWAYQYFLKDHLGNTRLIFSEGKSTTEYKATMEDNEVPVFSHYPTGGSRSALSLFNHTDGGTTYTYSQLLNGSDNNQVGLAKSFAVNPGDVFDLEVYAKYEAPGSTPNNVNTLLSQLVSAFSLGAGTTPLDGALAQSTFNDLFSAGPLITSSEWESAPPKAYLNYILFNENFDLIDFGFDQISEAGKQVGVTPTLHDYLSLHVKVQQKGYLYVYLSNEQPTLTNVYFDDMKIVRYKAVEQLSDYYPFGLTFNLYSRENSFPNLYQYNNKELQDELNLGWLDYGARMYQPDLGRWGAADPMADVMPMMSPYAYALNNPIKYVDKDGSIPIIPLLLKAGANGAADMLMQVAMNYYFDDKSTTLAAAFDNVNWWQVSKSAAEGLIPWSIPGGRLGRAAGTAVGDVMANAFHGGSNYSGEQALKDFAVGIIGDLAGGGLGDLISKYGADGVARGLGKMGFDAKTVDKLTGILDWNFSSSDPLVGDLANSLDNSFGKGTVKDVDVAFSSAAGIGDVDISLVNVNIEVKSGGKMKLTQSLKNAEQAKSQGKKYFLYMPKATSAQINEAAKQGITIYKNQEDLMKAIGN